MLRFYASNVDYYNKGLVPKDYVEADKARYFKRWPKRTFVVKRNLVFSPAANGIDKNISYMTEYNVSNSEKSLTGKAAVFITLTKKDDQLLIIKEAEDVFRN